MGSQQCMENTDLIFYEPFSSLGLKRMTMKLVPIAQDGSPAEVIEDLSVEASAVLKSVEELYKKFGYSLPWVGYLAVEDGHCVGTCAFKAAPENNRVEIAYFTFPRYEGRGIATRLAKLLVEIARRTSSSVTITAQTLAEENASTAVLRKVGFEYFSTIEHPEDGQVWEWHFHGPYRT